MKQASFSNTFILKSWLTLLKLVLISYFFFITNFTFGNHDWEWLKHGTSITTSFFEARFSQFIFPYLFFDNHILPVLTTALALTFFTLGATLLLDLFDTPKKIYLYTLLGTSIVLAPNTLSWHYFALNILSNFIWVFLIILSFLLLKKYYSTSNFIISVFFLTLAINGYPPVLNLIGVLFFCLIINDLDDTHLSISNIIKKSTPLLLAVILSVSIVYFVEHILKKTTTYNTETIAFTDLSYKLITSLLIALKQFVVTKSFFTPTYKYLNLTLVIIAFLNLCFKLKTSKKHFYTFLLATLGVLYSSVFSTLISKNTDYVLYEPRIEFFGLVYIYAFSVIILLKSDKTIFKNFCFVALVILLFQNITTNFYASKVWRLGYNSEMKLIDRIQNRLNNDQNFNLQKNYTFIQGGTLDFRSRYYLKDQSTPDSYTLTAPYISWYLPSFALEFFAQKNIVNQDFDVYWTLVNKDRLHLTPNLKYYLQNNTSFWPSNSALYIDEETIILTLTGDGRNRKNQWIKQNL